jgi:ATP-dependent Lon protease
MADSLVLERTADSTVIRTGGNGQKLSIPNVIPILPIRNIVVFPGTVIPLNVGRQKSKNLLDEVMPGEKVIGVITQRNADVEDPQQTDLYPMGVACMILKLFKLPDGNQSIIVHGLARFRLLSIEQREPFVTGKIEIVEDTLAPGAELDALIGSRPTASSSFLRTRLMKLSTCWRRSRIHPHWQISWRRTFRANTPTNNACSKSSTSKSACA